MRKSLIAFGAIVVGIFWGWSSVIAAELTTVNVFWQEGCPHCAAERSFLTELAARRNDFIVRDFPLTVTENVELFGQVVERLQLQVIGVPVTVIGQKYLLGYRDAATTGAEIVALLDAPIGSDLVSEILSGEMSVAAEPVIVDEPVVPSPSVEPPRDVVAAEPAAVSVATEMAEVPEEKSGITASLGTVKLPLVGEIKLSEVSLPVLTITLGLLDGFNPCAMWVLLFLMSLLVGVADRRRAWILGLAFLLGTALVYLAFLAAWLQLFLLLGLILAVRIVIGIFAVGVGVWYLRDFWINRDGGCQVVGDRWRDRIFRRAKAAVHGQSLWLGVLGMLLLAAVVNLIEVACSAGLPAVFTQVLAMAELAPWQRWSYLLLYLAFFLLDDLVVFVSAMVLLRLVGIQHRYARHSRLIGGIVILGIGLVMLLKPQWLTGLGG